MSKPVVVHYLRRGKRKTACGREAAKTTRDTRVPSRVTCATCRRVVASWRAACAELQD
jgi:hypothetical protein